MKDEPIKTHHQNPEVIGYRGEEFVAFLYKNLDGGLDGGLLQVQSILPDTSHKFLELSITEEKGDENSVLLRILQAFQNRGYNGLHEITPLTEEDAWVEEAYAYAIERLRFVTPFFIKRKAD